MRATFGSERVRKSPEVILVRSDDASSLQSGLGQKSRVRPPFPPKLLNTGDVESKSATDDSNISHKIFVDQILHVRDLAYSVEAVSAAPDAVGTRPGQFGLVCGYSFQSSSSSA